MSNRTLVELNHDYCPQDGDYDALLDWAEAICTYMKSGDKKCLPRGVEFKYARHHSDPDPMAGYLKGNEYID